MIERHKNLPYLEDDTVLWRYMDISKFAVLLKDCMLYLNRLDNFADKKEGYLPLLDEILFGYRNSDEYAIRDRKRYFMNCWMISECESSLMWATYGTKGAAIKTTARKLAESLEKDADHKCHLFPVKYIDDLTESTHEPGENKNHYRLIYTKRKFFEQEHEARIIYFDCDRKYENQMGINVPIDTEKLIDQIVFSPTIDSESKRIVEILLQECKLPKAIPSCI